MINTRADIRDIVAYTATRPELRRKYKYNTKKLQHYVESEWIGMDTTKTTSGRRHEVSTNAQNLGEEAENEVENLPSEEDGEPGQGKARPFVAEDTECPSRVLSSITLAVFVFSRQDVWESVEKSMSDLLARISKLHDQASKLRDKQNPAYSDVHKRHILEIHACLYCVYGICSNALVRHAAELERYASKMEECYDHLAELRSEEKRNNGEISATLKQLASNVSPD